jgi:hypothetical protein
VVEGLVGGAGGGHQLAGVLEHPPRDVLLVVHEPLVVVDHAVAVVLRDDPLVGAALAQCELRVDPPQRAHHLARLRQHLNELLGAVCGHVAQREVDVSHGSQHVAPRHTRSKRGMRPFGRTLSPPQCDGARRPSLAEGA